MWRRAGVAGVIVGAVARVVFLFFRSFGKQTGWNCDREALEPSCL